jgi:hypothetical protein
MNLYRKIEVELLAEGFVIVPARFKYNIVKPDRDFESIGIADERFTLVEHAKTMLDMVQCVIVALRFAIRVYQSLVNRGAVIPLAVD